MITPTFRPIVNWPGARTAEPKRSPFHCDFNRNLRQLSLEIEHLEARNLVIQLAIGEHEIRNDGWPRAEARPKHPGVIVAFTTKGGAISMPCDTYSDWHDNLRAITLALGALRAIDRYGVTKHGEQYTGWKQLPGPLITPPPMSLEEAAKIVGKAGGVEGAEKIIVEQRSAFEKLYRFGVMTLHPDRHGGKELPEWHRLQEAAGLLKKHHGI